MARLQESILPLFSHVCVSCGPSWTHGKLAFHPSIIRREYADESCIDNFLLSIQTNNNHEVTLPWKNFRLLSPTSDICLPSDKNGPLLPTCLHEHASIMNLDNSSHERFFAPPLKAACPDVNNKKNAAKNNCRNYTPKQKTEDAFIHED